MSFTIPPLQHPHEGLANEPDGIRENQVQIPMVASPLNYDNTVLKKYFCDVCNECFKTPLRLKIHKDNHLDSCLLCCRRFKSGKIDKHLRKRHKMILDTPALQNFTAAEVTVAGLAGSSSATAVADNVECLVTSEPPPLAKIPMKSQPQRFVTSQFPPQAPISSVGLFDFNTHQTRPLGGLFCPAPRPPHLAAPRRPQGRSLCRPRGRSHYPRNRRPAYSLQRAATERSSMTPSNRLTFGPSGAFSQVCSGGSLTSADLSHVTSPDSVVSTAVESPTSKGVVPQVKIEVDGEVTVEDSSRRGEHEEQVVAADQNVHQTPLPHARLLAGLVYPVPCYPEVTKTSHPQFTTPRSPPHHPLTSDNQYKPAAVPQHAETTNPVFGSNGAFSILSRGSLNSNPIVGSPSPNSNPHPSPIQLGSSGPSSFKGSYTVHWGSALDPRHGDSPDSDESSTVGPPRNERAVTPEAEGQGLEDDMWRPW